jgi:hypothetical protein
VFAGARAHARPTAGGPGDPGSDRRPKFQISLSLMLLLMVVFAFISAALYYASRVPAIREEISVLLTGEAEASEEDVGRVAHRAFIMFTFTSPLLLAGVLSTVMSLLNMMQRGKS